MQCEGKLKYMSSTFPYFYYDDDYCYMKGGIHISN